MALMRLTCEDMEFLFPTAEGRAFTIPSQEAMIFTLPTYSTLFMYEMKVCSYNSGEETQSTFNQQSTRVRKSYSCFP